MGKSWEKLGKKYAAIYNQKKTYRNYGMAFLDSFHVFANGLLFHNEVDLLVKNQIKPTHLTQRQREK